MDQAAPYHLCNQWLREFLTVFAWAWSLKAFFLWVSKIWPLKLQSMSSRRSHHPRALSTHLATATGITLMTARAESTVFWPEEPTAVTVTTLRPPNPHIHRYHQHTLSSASVSISSITRSYNILLWWTDTPATSQPVIEEHMKDPEVCLTANDTTHNRGTNPVTIMTLLFATFGIPDECANDGGPEVPATASRKFLQKGGGTIAYPQLHFYTKTRGENCI